MVNNTNIYVEKMIEAVFTNDWIFKVFITV